MQEDGRVIVNYQPRRGLPNFWRMVFVNPRVEEDDLQFVIDETERYSQIVGRNDAILEAQNI